MDEHSACASREDCLCNSCIHDRIGKSCCVDHEMGHCHDYCKDYVYDSFRGNNDE